MSQPPIPPVNLTGTNANYNSSSFECCQQIPNDNFSGYFALETQSFIVGINSGSLYDAI